MRLLFTLLSLGISVAQAAPTIPEPLTLQQALTFASESHPQQQLINADLRSAEAAARIQQQSRGISVDLNGRIRWKELQQSGSERNDNELALIARKPLYDFGRSALAEEIAAGAVEEQRALQREAVEQRKLLIMERFFAVLEADLQRTVDDEVMTIAYLRFKKKEDKIITGEYSELDLLQGESRFQDALAKQKQSEMVQRLSRIRLADAMNRPGEIPSTLIAPLTTPDQIAEQIGGIAVLQQQLEAENRQLHRLRQQITQAERRVAQAKLGNGPELDATVELLENSLVTSSKDRWRASLLLEVPLMDNGINGEQIVQARAQLHKAEARLEQQQRTLREQLEQYHLQLKVLKAQWKADQIAAEYRDIELDRNRALYEQEQQSNLGDALVGISRSHLRSAKSRFQAMLVKARIEQLIGKEIVVHE